MPIWPRGTRIPMLVNLGTPILEDVDRIVTSVDIGDGALTIAAQPDLPRSITIDWTDANDSVTGGLATIVGELIDGSVFTEVLTMAGGTEQVETNACFAKITSITISGVTGTPAAGTDVQTVGVGSKVALPFPIKSITAVKHCYLGVRTGSNAVADPRISSVDASAATYDGAKNLLVAVIMGE